MLAKKNLFIVGITSNILEWYDFVLYGYFANIFGILFFPNIARFASLAASFGVFAVAYLARPVGGLVFGYIGDKYGRKASLTTSIMLMGVSSVLMSILPGYSTIGIWAPLLLSLVRLLQGFAIGGGFTGSVIYITEMSAKKHVNFFASLPSFGTFLGILAGSAIAVLISSLFSDISIQSYGWRIPFACGGAAVLVGLWMYKKMPDSTVFLESTHHKEKKIPCKEILLYQSSDLFKAIALCFSYAVFTYIPFIFTTTYLNTYLNTPMHTALLSNTLSMALLTVLLLLAGWLADKYSRNKILSITFWTMVITSLPLFYLLAHNNFFYILAAQSCFAIITAPLQALIPIALTDLFTFNTKYTGISLAYHTTLSLFGGTAPLVSMFLIHWSGSILAPGVYLVVAAIISLLGFLWFQKSGINSKTRIDLLRNNN